MSTNPVHVGCSACGREFDVPASLRGGFANCPDCGRATQVPGGAEPLFWLAIAGGVFAVLAATGLAYLAGGAAPAAIVFGLAALVLLIAVLAM